MFRSTAWLVFLGQVFVLSTTWPFFCWEKIFSLNRLALLKKNNLNNLAFILKREINLVRTCRNMFLGCFCWFHKIDVKIRTECEIRTEFCFIKTRFPFLKLRTKGPQGGAIAIFTNGPALRLLHSGSASPMTFSATHALCGLL